MIQYLVKNQVDRIQCNDTGKRIYEKHLLTSIKESQHR